MAFSVLRNFGIKAFYGIANAPEVITQSIKPALFSKLPILSNNSDTSLQVTSVRWRTRVPKPKKTGQFPPDFFKVNNFSTYSIINVYSYIIHL